MIGQFIGGATLIQTVTGVPYWAGLLLFGAVVVLYTAFGGFRAVVLTDTLQGIVMTCGTFLMLFFIIRQCGGMEDIVNQLNVSNPGWDLMGKGAYGKGHCGPSAGVHDFLLGAGGHCGAGASADGGALHGVQGYPFHARAMIYGTVVIGILMIGMHLAGTLAYPLVENANLASTDQVIPYVVMKYMRDGPRDFSWRHPWRR